MRTMAAKHNAGPVLPGQNKCSWQKILNFESWDSGNLSIKVCAKII